MSQIVPKVGDYLISDYDGLIIEVIAITNHNFIEGKIVKVGTIETNWAIGQIGTDFKPFNENWKLCNFMNSPMWKKIEGIK